MSARESDDVALRDLVVGEPAVHRVLDGEAARARADHIVREASADPRIAAVVERIGDAAAAQPEPGDPSVRAAARDAEDAASEIQRPTQRIAAAKPSTAHPTQPDLDTHKRVTDPRLDRAPMGAPPLDEVGEAVERARKSLRASAGQARTDHQRLAVLGATALAVGLILLALLLTRDPGPRPGAPTAAPTTEPTTEPGIIPVETVLPVPSPSASALATPPSAQVPSAQVPSATAPGPSPSVVPSARPGVETNPKSSAPKPGPSQDVPTVPPTPSSDRPF